MWFERIKRIIILVLAGGIIFSLFPKVFSEWQRAKKEKPVSLPTEEIKGKIEDWGEKVLGEAIKIIPENNNLKEKIPQLKKSEENSSSKENNEIKIETEKIIEILRQLPQEQLEEIKKAVLKEFCQEVLKE
ncbi:MAG: hypothetical protein ACPLKP_01565 [Microgenomates group bacterium]